MPRAKKEYNDRRSKRVEVRLTPGEENSLNLFAKESGLSLSDFIRKRALGSKPRLQQATPERAVFIKSLAELGKIGSNVNQIARALNTDLAKGYYLSVPGKMISGALNDIQTLSVHLVNVLTNGDTR